MDEDDAKLRERALPEGGVGRWRRAIVALVAVAVVVNATGSGFAAWILLAFAGVFVVRYVRREWALGTLIRRGRAHDEAISTLPTRDLREPPDQ